MKQLSSYFSGRQIFSVLDIATGTGHFIKVLKEIFPEANFTGIDTDPKSVGQAGQNLNDSRTRFIRMDADKIDFPDKSFDLASVSKALHHLPFLEQSFAEMKRVLKPGGFILISEPYNDNLNPAQENQKFFHHMRSYSDLKTGVYHRKTWARSEIIALVEENGIKPDLIFDYTDGKELITESDPVEGWVSRYKLMVDKLEGFPEYTQLVPKIEEFRQRIIKHGLQPVPAVVIVGRC